MSVQLAFAMSRDSSAAIRVQSMLLPYDGRFDNQWVEEGEHAFLFIEVPEGGLDTFIDDVHACHPSVERISGKVLQG